MASSRPASRIEHFAVTAASMTLQSAPQETSIEVQDGELVGVTIDIPPGHAGLTGIRLLLAHSQVIPYTQGAWLTGNDRQLDFETIGYPTTGAWSVQVYNLDRFEHLWNITLEIADFPYVTAAPAETLTPTPQVV